MMIVQERWCFPHGLSWGLRLSKYLPSVVLHLIMQDGGSAVGPVWGLTSSRNWRYGGEDSGRTRHQGWMEVQLFAESWLQSRVRKHNCSIKHDQGQQKISTHYYFDWYCGRFCDIGGNDHFYIITKRIEMITVWFLLEWRQRIAAQRCYILNYILTRFDLKINFN